MLSDADQVGLSRFCLALELVAKQAEDEGLWFGAQTLPEAYLQDALRALHAILEGRVPEDTALEYLERVSKATKAEEPA